MPSRCRSVIPLLALIALAGAVGCGPELTPEEKIDLLRSQYTAELKSLQVKQDPTAEGIVAEDAAMAESGSAPAEPAAEEAAEMAVEPATPVDTEVILDILVSTTSQEYLPGITLELEHVDAARREKERRTMWVDTSSLTRGGGTQITEVLKDVDWQPGDGFYVEVRFPIPPEERSNYREFQ